MRKEIGQSDVSAMAVKSKRNIKEVKFEATSYSTSLTIYSDRAIETIAKVEGHQSHDQLDVINKGI